MTDAYPRRQAIEIARLFTLKDAPTRDITVRSSPLAGQVGGRSLGSAPEKEAAGDADGQASGRQ
jgi:hypothetical protein